MNTAAKIPQVVADRATSRLRSLKSKHHVRRLARGMYEVTSGRTGATYRVDLAAMSCDCYAGKMGRVCDHKIAALSLSNALSQMAQRTQQAQQKPPVTPAVPVAPQADDVRYYRDRFGRVEMTINGFTI